MSILVLDSVPLYAENLKQTHLKRRGPSEDYLSAVIGDEDEVARLVAWRWRSRGASFRVWKHDHVGCSGGRVQTCWVVGHVAYKLLQTCSESDATRTGRCWVAAEVEPSSELGCGIRVGMLLQKAHIELC